MRSEYSTSEAVVMRNSVQIEGRQTGLPRESSFTEYLDLLLVPYVILQCSAMYPQREKRSVDTRNLQDEQSGGCNWRVKPVARLDRLHPDRPDSTLGIHK